MRDIQLRKGDFFAISNGEYSDYSVGGFFKSLTELNLSKSFHEWANETGRVISYGDALISDYDQPEETENQPDFIGWMIARKLIEPVTYSEIHMGSYGTTELSLY